MTINQDKKERTGTIFDVQGLSVHDGPGCRTLIFLNGCTLNCFWCSNPEGISPKPVPLHFQSKCISCDQCIQECDKAAIQRRDGTLIIDRRKCAKCEDKSCVSVCFTDGLKLSGYEISIRKLYQIIQRDRQFWGQEGGITLSGGEPLYQIDFAAALLKSCHDAYIHTAIETCGNIPYKNFQRVIPYLDWIFFDLKHFDPNKHKKATQSDNLLILENAKRLAKEFEGRLIFRIPLIPEFNSSLENINSMISFLKEVGKTEVNILPLHHLGRDKYKLLNLEYTGEKHPIPDAEMMQEVKQTFKKSGISCYIGAETPF